MEPPRIFFVQDAMQFWNTRSIQEKRGICLDLTDKAQFLREIANRLSPGRHLEKYEWPRFVINQAWSKDFKIAIAYRIAAAVFACGAFAVWNGMKHNPFFRVTGTVGNLMLFGAGLFMGHMHGQVDAKETDKIHDFSKFLNDLPVKAETFERLLLNGTSAKLLPLIELSRLSPEEAFNTSSINVSQILPGLYLGNQGGAGIIPAHENPALRENAIRNLQGKGVDRILSCIGADIRDPFFKYLSFTINDNSANENLAKYFDEAFNFIESARMGDSGVFVHCNAGLSRSPSIVIAYLMRKYGLSFEQAFDFVKAKRPCVNPRELFVEQLKAYEKTLAKS